MKKVRKALKWALMAWCLVVVATLMVTLGFNTQQFDHYLAISTYNNVPGNEEHTAKSFVRGAYRWIFALPIHIVDGSNKITTGLDWQDVYLSPSKMDKSFLLHVQGDSSATDHSNSGIWGSLMASVSTENGILVGVDASEPWFFGYLWSEEGYGQVCTIVCQPGQTQMIQVHKGPGIYFAMNAKGEMLKLEQLSPLTKIRNPLFGGIRKL